MQPEKIRLSDAERAEVDALADRVREGDRSALSQALNQVDDNRPQHRERALHLLDALAQGTGPAGHSASGPTVNGAQAAGVRIGVTGAPGSGKSTLLDTLAMGMRDRGRSVGVLAVDPSSQRTGGALLGDRMRLGSAARDAGVFLRSLAARDQLGGLSEVTGPSLDVLASALDAVFVETVGVGQSEAQIIDLVDTLVFVAQPAAGDLIQFMKAGILEWPDVFFVNKSDLGDLASRTAAELKSGIDLGSRRDESHKPKVLCGSARDGVGIDDLIEAIDDHQEHLLQSSQGEKRRREGSLARVRTTLATRYGRHGLAVLAQEGAFETLFDEYPRCATERIADELGRRIEEAMVRGVR